MSYAGDLIDRARKTTGQSQNALAARLGVSGPTLSQWRNGVGSPMPQERVLELCDLAHITDEGERGYWLVGVQRDAVTITSVRRAIDTALDRLRPAVAAVGLLFLVVGGAVSGSMPIMSNWARGKLRERRSCKAGHERSTGDAVSWHAGIVRA